MKMFRWAGLIGFVVLTLLFGVIGFFFIDSWVKTGLETAGFQVNTAEVDVGSVSLSLNPIGFQIEQVQVADADKPTHNAVEFDKVNLELNLPQLFLGNVRIHDVTVDGIQTNTERQRRAKVQEKTPKETSSDNSAQEVAAEVTEKVSNQLPTPQDAVTAQIQNTQDAVEFAQQTLTQSKSQLESATKNLPTDEDLATYKKRIAEIKKVKLDSLDNIKKMQSLLSSVSSDVAEDKLQIETVKKTVTGAVSSSKTAVADVTKAPAKDWQALKDNYPLNTDTAIKIAQRLLGDDFFNRIEQAQYWYGKARPWLAKLKSQEEEDSPERLAGEFIRYPHPDPTAAFHLDHGQLSFIADNWPWQLTIDDLTSHSGDFFQPTQLLLQRGETDNAALQITGLLDRVDGKSVDTFEFLGRGISFNGQDVELAGTTLNWVPEAANVSGQIISTDGQLEGVVSLLFPENKMTASGSSDASGYVAKAVQRVSSFQIDIEVSGSVGRPSFSLKSDLDNQLSSALADVAKAEYETWLVDVRQQLDAEVARLREPADQQLTSLEQRKAGVDDRIQSFETEVEQEIASLQAKVKAEQKRLEDAARKKVEDKAKEKLNNIKDKLKF